MRISADSTTSFFLPAHGQGRKNFENILEFIDELYLCLITRETIDRNLHKDISVEVERSLVQPGPSHFKHLLSVSPERHGDISYKDFCCGL